MARRLNPHHQTDIRRKIQASVLIDRLQKHAEGEIKMTSSQISAANSLLDRSVAKLQQIQLSGDEEGGPLKIQIVRYADDNPAE